jgi:beta-mannosidase
LFGNSRSISYAPSSTSNGYLTLNFSKPQPFTERYYNITPGHIYGETDYYNYDSSQSFNVSSYPIGRFSNEFGFLSMPSSQTWSTVLAPADMHFNSTTITLRNHLYPPRGLNTSNFDNAKMGMGFMTMAAQRWYPVPHKSDPYANFSAWCHTTQIFQADFYKSQIKFYRRGSGMPERQLGCLYWQLEDIWQASTWAGVEYGGRWKVLHYIAADAYKNVIISPFYNETTGQLEVWITSDLWSKIKGTASMKWYDWSGRSIGIDPSIMPETVDVTVGAINSTRILSMNLTDAVSAHKLDPRNLVLHLNVTAVGSLPNSNNNETQIFTHGNFFHAAPLSSAILIDPGLTFEYDNDTNEFVVQATKGMAAWVWLEYEGAQVVTFEDNGFWLLPGVEKRLTWKVRSGELEKNWVGNVSVTSLWDNTIDNAT